MNKDY